MKIKKRRSYTKEFKEEAVKLVLDQGYSIAEASRNLGIHPNLLGYWKRETQYGGSDKATTSIKTELKELRKENKRLKMEREILKKAAAFFAKELV